jgi:hypothetical protein
MGLLGKYKTVRRVVNALRQPVALVNTANRFPNNFGNAKFQSAVNKANFDPTNPAAS